MRKFLKIKWGEQSRTALGIRQGVLDGDDHAGLGELGQHGSIDPLYHAVNDALRMDHDLDLFDGHIEEKVRFDHLESFVHQGGTVDGDFRSRSEEHTSELQSRL